MNPPPVLSPTPARRPPGVGLHAILGGLIVGGVGFAGGFFGPMILTPESNQGPLLGIFITGPIGFVVGLIGGAMVGLMRRQEGQGSDQDQPDAGV